MADIEKETMKAGMVRPASFLIIGLLLASCTALRHPYTCTDPLGCVEIGQGDSFVIGNLAATSGDYSSIGIDARRGVQLAILDQGNLMGHHIYLLNEETDCSEEGVRSAATDLILNSKLLAVIGPTCTGEMSAAGEILTEAGILAISPSSMRWGAGLQVAPVFSTPETDLSAGFAIRQLGAKQAVIVGDAPESHQADEILQQIFTRQGGGARVLQIPPGSLEFQSQLADLRLNPPDVLFLHLPPTQAGLFMAQFRSTPGLETMKIIGWENLIGPEFLQNAGQAAAGMYMVGPAQSVFGGPYPGFALRYETAFGEKPIAISDLYSYMVAQLIFHAIQTAAVRTAGGVLFIPRSALQKAIQTPGGYPSLFGVIACAGTGGCSTIQPAIYQIGSREELSWYPGENTGQVYP
ncbi:MAG: ABC transporter substrate-binding protein [Anaerolineales bacterium]